jgi:hypothetical protein
MTVCLNAKTKDTDKNHNYAVESEAATVAI